MRLLLIFLLLFTKPVFSQEPHYFNFSLDKRIFTPNSSIDIIFLHDLETISEDRFTILPMLSKGLVSDWGYSWEKAPTLSNFPRLNLFGLENSSTELFFRIQDTKTGKVYETPTKKIWITNILDQYIDSLNQNISNWEMLE